MEIYRRHECPTKPGNFAKKYDLAYFLVKKTFNYVMYLTMNVLTMQSQL